MHVSLHDTYFLLSVTYKVQSQFHSRKLLEANDRTYPITCEEWRASLARTLTMKPDNTRREMLNILVCLTT